MERISEGKKIICTKEKLGFTVGKKYEINHVNINGDQVTISTDLPNFSVTLGVGSDTCLVDLYEHFGFLKDERRKKLKKLYGYK